MGFVFMRRQLEASAATSAGQYNLNLKSLGRVHLPVSRPSTEQMHIIGELARAMSMIAADERILSTTHSRAERLRQAVSLQRASRGELV